MTQDELKEYLIDIKNEIEDDYAIDLPWKLRYRIEIDKSSWIDSYSFGIRKNDVGQIQKSVIDLLISRFNSLFEMDPDILFLQAYLYTDKNSTYNNWDTFKGDLQTITSPIYSLQISVHNKSINKNTIKKFEHFT
jgi:hypothetical protein